MRATVRAFSPLIIGFVSCAAAAAGVISCADALHLNPAGTGGDAGATTGSGGPACRSAHDCTYPTSICDPVGNVCVECVSTGDCEATKPGTVCSKGACACASDAKAAPTYCPGSDPVCVDTETSPTDCGSCGHACFGSCAGGACVGAWEPTSMDGAPDPRSHHVAVWATPKSGPGVMFVWGGLTMGGAPTNTGALYDPVKRTWTPTSQYDAPTPRADATAVYDSDDGLILVWGGATQANDGDVLDDGAAYDPVKNVWTPMPPAVPSALGSGRAQHAAAWASGIGMIVCGGIDGSGAPLQDAASYVPGPGNTAGMWNALPSMPGLPRARHTAVWTGMELFVYGGFNVASAGPPPVSGYLDDLSSYDTMNMWTPLTMGTPSARADHTATWDDMTASMVVYGGAGPGMAALSDGAIYVAGNWMGFANTGPEARTGHTAVDIAGKVYVFGGDDAGGNPLGNGGVLDVGSISWSPLPTGPSPRSHHTAVGTGTKMIVWGGKGPGGPTNTGAIFDPTKM